MNWNQTELVASQTVLASGVGRQNFPHPAQVASPHGCPTVGTGTSMNCIVMVIGISCSLVMVMRFYLEKHIFLSTAVGPPMSSS
mgnify:CR=1 FL=1